MYSVTLTPLNTVEDDVVIDNAVEVSFMNGASFGPSSRFGIDPGFEGKKVFINVNAFTAVEVAVTG